MNSNFYYMLAALCTSAYLQATQVSQQHIVPVQQQTTSLELKMIAEAEEGTLTRERLDHYLKQGVDIEVRDKGGSTALMKAVYSGNTEIVQLLIAAGADPEIINERDSNKKARDYALDKDLYDKAVAAGLAERKRYLAAQKEAKEIIELHPQLCPSMSRIIAGYAYGSSVEDLPASKIRKKRPLKQTQTKAEITTEAGQTKRGKSTPVPEACVSSAGENSSDSSMSDVEEDAD